MSKEKLSITKRTYGNYSNNNYGTHCIQIRIGCVTIWFSYNTIVAIQDGLNTLFVSENCWGSTTGKHLNAIDGGDKKKHLSRTNFEAEIEKILKAHSLVYMQ